MRGVAGVPVLSSFVVIDVPFSLVHNLSGTADRDLPAHEAVLLVASVLGYVNALGAIAFLIRLRRERRAITERVPL